MNAAFAVQAIPNDLVSLNELVKLLLQVIVLVGEHTRVALKSHQFVLKAVSGIEEGLVARTRDVEFPR